MSKPLEYKSIISSYIREFIELKDNAGYNTRNYKFTLLEIDRFFLDNNIKSPTITRELIAQWRKTRINDSVKTLYQKSSTWAQLARFMSHHGCECFIPQLPRYTRSTRPGYAPYIFTHEQIATILRKSSELKMYNCDLHSSLFCIPTIIRLLYSTGLRISEALSIRNADVNLQQNYIHIRKTKNGCERIVPISLTLKTVILQYESYRNKIPIKNIAIPDGFFFIKPDGSNCQAQAIYKWFRRLLRECDIPYTGNNQGPRLHDLRHTMAVHSLEQMIHCGMDLYASMPILATCLGHKSLSSTGQYVRLTYEMYPELEKQCSALAEFIYPKI
ncbi:tyrosine-type recombinase/integrase [uncultured Bacteroides sp.]|uniref:tyrosine-type recombinase/integrase n=1 Tax=uncultured Bacteroides sp. TaxID=162156 RepID=UPI002588AE21|nr:tyrosine-type recombinase/integrase [uncultured Bacteroides sp.]